MPTGSYKANRVVLANNQSGAGTYPAVPVEVYGGTYMLVCEGAFAGTTVTLNKLGPNDTASQVAGVSITAAGADTVLDIAMGTQMTVTFTGGAPVGMYVSLVKVR